jgi:CRP-like cAMP-binding protein
MLLDFEWADRFLKACARLRSAHRRRLEAGRPIYSGVPKGRCWVVARGYVRLFDLRNDGDRLIRLFLGRGSLFGDHPFESNAFRGFSLPDNEHADAHGPAEVIEFSREELESASQSDRELCRLLLESAATRSRFLERRLDWQLTVPVRARIAATLRDLICFSGDRCRHGHTIDIRLTHQDLSELVDVARPVVSAELVRLRDEGLIAYTRSYFCVNDLAGLNRASK